MFEDINKISSGSLNSVHEWKPNILDKTVDELEQLEFCEPEPVKFLILIEESLVVKECDRCHALFRGKDAEAMKSIAQSERKQKG